MITIHSTKWKVYPTFIARTTYLSILLSTTIKVYVSNCTFASPDALLQALFLEESCNCISLEEHTWVTQKLSIKLSEVVIRQ